MLHKFLYGLLVMLAVSCTDELVDGFDGPMPEGEAAVTFDAAFHPLSDATIGRTRSLGGDAIKTIRNIFVVWYDTDGDNKGRYVGSQYFTADQFTTLGNEPRPGSTTETETQHAEFSCPLPYGKYRIYAVANMGDLSSDSRYKEQIDSEETFKAISLEWVQDDIAKNDQMSGHFTATETAGYKKGDAPTIQIDRPNIKLHAWLRRAASKVTLAFNTEKLKDNIFIYIKSVQIKNVPKHCTLIDDNDEKKISAAEHVYEEGDTIRYGRGEDYKQWPRLTKGNSPLGPELHANDASSLFFFENMQGTGQSKKQSYDGVTIEHPNGNTPGDPGYRDGKNQGTYIEVEGYYVSNTMPSIGHGKIFYRFMLGMDEDKDYNAERNYHYKITLMFNGDANDVDWHIDYREEPGIHVPNPYYISYLHDEGMHLPISISGELSGTLKAEIIENNWKPDNPETGFEYWTGSVYNDGPWHGFLAVRKTNNLIIGNDDGINLLSVTSTSAGDRERKYNQRYWDNEKYGAWGLLAGEVVSPRGRREYNIAPAEYPDATDGGYTVTKSGDKTVFSIPFYTRALHLVPTSGFTGNNPYFSYMRKAVVRLTATINGKEETEDVTIYQVRRVINPKGIYRSHGNANPFKVVLLHREGESASTFSPFPSEGPWSAEIEVGQDWVRLNGGTDKIYGDTGDDIEFEFAPAGTIGEDESRFGIIKVCYHDTACVHRIIVRQGYAPAQIVPGGVKWHSYNLRSDGIEAASPIEEGSMFRFGNIADAIDASNNTAADLYRDHKDTPFILSPVENKQSKPWKNIEWESNKNIGFTDHPQTIDGKTCRVAEYKDFQSLRDNCVTAYGVVYDDSSDGVSTNVDDAFSYRYDNASNYNKGMRGCIVFNPTTGANIFLPIGAAGNGRRKHGYKEGSKRAVLRYAHRSERYTNPDPIYCPLFYTIYQQFGAVYWLNKLADSNTAWDINVSTYNFKGFTNDALDLPTTDPNTDGKQSDAGFIRLVEDND